MEQTQTPNKTEMEQTHEQYKRVCNIIYNNYLTPMRNNKEQKIEILTGLIEWLNKLDKEVLSREQKKTIHRYRYKIHNYLLFKDIDYFKAHTPKDFQGKTHQAFSSHYLFKWDIQRLNLFRINDKRYRRNEDYPTHRTRRVREVAKFKDGFKYKMDRWTHKRGRFNHLPISETFKVFRELDKPQISQIS